MDLKFLDDDTNSNNNDELEKLKKENLLLKQQLADARADNFLTILSKKSPTSKVVR